MKRNRMALLGAGVIAVFVLVSAVGAWISPYDPIKQDLRFNLET
ncbi:MAG: ABC transporter permease, partial [Deltaproteobacteria bacterium]|nr:ABC transporter permease [Deltaproteobacteria bacterium]